ncbi:hypothetical protein ELI_3848 [Eubacterium callanderi]|uniref:Uncharacterized protein n=1 Tax=Eubacterium callanderi TaxID=53442 RepID=E3GGJ0_9FIRM|nr:hypothetical protein ELI_3848 [Eubacterium callanderi]
MVRNGGGEPSYYGEFFTIIMKRIMIRLFVPAVTSIVIQVKLKN